MPTDKERLDWVITSGVFWKPPYDFIHSQTKENIHTSGCWMREYSNGEWDDYESPDADDPRQAIDLAIAKEKEKTIDIVVSPESLLQLNTSLD